MSIWSRIANVFRSDELNREIAEEFESHIAEAVEQGREPDEARRALGQAHQQRRQRQLGYDARVVPWLGSLRADVIFGSRQLIRQKVATTAAVVSLALAVGACTAAFRLLDAMFLRPLPVADAARLFAVRFDGFTFQGEPIVWDTASYPVFQKMRTAVKGQAELIAIEPAQRAEITYASDDAIERANLQHVSGWMFSSFGIGPAIGRVLTEQDDRVPGAGPYAVLSYSYWASRFGRDPQVVGRSLRIGGSVYQIVGVAESRFTGTEPGTIPDIWVPVTMQSYVNDPGSGWLRVFVRPNEGVSVDSLRDKMYAAYRAHEQERAKSWTNIPKELLVGYPREKLLLKPAGSGVSLLQQGYRVGLIALAALVAIVLLIACANVANLMTAQAASRAREMALRVSLGAGRLRLVRLVLVESTMLASLAALLGGLFAWWSAPFVVSRINPPDNPARLILSPDWRVLAFALLLTLGVTLLFGLAPAMRASSVKPVNALKGGEDPHLRQRGMHVWIAVQVAFCFVALFLAGLFLKTFQHLSNRSLGFLPERVLLLDALTPKPLPAVSWDLMTERLRAMPGVAAVALSSWPLLSGRVDNELVAVDGAPRSNVIARFMSVSPGWIGAMRIPLRAGRDFNASDTDTRAALVSKTFARQFFGGANPVGKVFQTSASSAGKPDRIQVVGLVDDAAYKDIHDAMLPVAYLPIHQADGAGQVKPVRGETFVVRTANDDPLTLAATLRQEMQRMQATLRVTTTNTEMDLVRAQSVRERLLATLATFFAAVALLLAAIGLYGVLSYSVLQREREFGIRLAIGATIGSIARLVTAQVFLMVLAGAALGGAVGMASARYVQALLYGVRGNDPTTLLLSALVLLLTALLSALPAVVRAARIDPTIMLRAQ